MVWVEFKPTSPLVELWGFTKLYNAHLTSSQIKILMFRMSISSYFRYISFHNELQPQNHGQLVVSLQVYVIILNQIYIIQC